MCRKIMEIKFRAVFLLRIFINSYKLKFTEIWDGIEKHNVCADRQAREVMWKYFDVLDKKKRGKRKFMKRKNLG